MLLLSTELVKDAITFIEFKTTISSIEFTTTIDLLLPILT
jgi:hypothetical protein